MTKLSVGLLMAVVFTLAAVGAQQEGGGGLRFPNLFAGLGGGNNPFSLSNLFRQGRPAQQQPPPLPPPPVGFAANPQVQQPFPGPAPPLSPIAVQQQPGPNPFLQAPPPAFQPTAFPTFVQNPGSPPLAQFQQPPGFVQPQAQFQPSQPVPVQQPAPFVFSNNNNNPLVPALVPIGNLPIASQTQQQQQQQAAAPTQQPAIIPSPPGPPLPPPPTPTPPIVPSQALPPAAAPAAQQQPLLLPAQFALSANSPSQHKNSARTGKSFALPKGDLTAAASSNVIDCGAGNDLGFCASSEKYPRSVVDDMMHRCHETVRQMYAEIPEDYEGLGDSHHPAAGIGGENGSFAGKNPSLPWSWSDYRKESACDSELRFIQPHVAQDRSGRWRIIVQTDEFPQRVAIDVCRRVNDVCKVFTDCGRKSRCVQRYSYQPLISLDQDAKAAGQCPTMAVFRFPTSCVCHVEVEKPVPIKSERRALSINGVKVRS